MAFKHVLIIINIQEETDKQSIFLRWGFMSGPRNREVSAAPIALLFHT